MRDAFRTSAFLPISQRLVMIVGGSVSVMSAPHWQLVLVNPSTGAFDAIAFNDSAILASDTLAFTVLGPSDVVLVSSDTAGWVVNFTRVTTIAYARRLASIDAHLLRATAALGCGQVAVSVDVLPTTIPATNSSIPFAVVVMYAEPTPLSAVRSPFWYFLFVDSTMDTVTYLSIDAPPLFLAQLTLLPLITQLMGAAYSITTGSTLVYEGSGFLPSAMYDCRTNSSTTRALVLNSTVLQCTIPAGLIHDILAPTLGSTSSLLPVQLSVDGVFVLYRAKVVVVGSVTSGSINRSTVSTGAISRMMVSYFVSSSLTPSPVISAALPSSAASSAPTTSLGQQSALHLHSQLTRGLTFINQQLTNISETNPGLTGAQILPGLTRALSSTDWAQSIGLSDAYALFSVSAMSADVDFTNMYSSAVGVMSQDISSLPQTLTGLITGGASFLSLDMIGVQARDWLTSTLSPGDTSSSASDLVSTLDQGAILPAVSSTVLSQLSSLALDSVLLQLDSLPALEDVLLDSSMLTLLHLPAELESALANPTELIASFLPSGALKDIVLSLLNHEDGDIVSFTGSLTDTVGTVLDDIDGSVSDIADSVSDLGFTFLDDIASSAIQFESGSLVGPIGALAGLVTKVLGGSSTVVQIVQIVTSAVGVVSGLAEIYFGDIGNGLSDVLSGIASLFGFGGGGNEDSQLASQMTQDFNEVLNGISQLSNQINSDTNLILGDLSTVQSNLLQADFNLSQQINQGFTALNDITIAGFTTLQQQQYAYYSSEMQALSSVLKGVQSDTLSLSAAATQVQAQAEVLSSIAQMNKVQRDNLINTLEGYMTTVQVAIASGQSSFPSAIQRSLPSAVQLQYEEGMLSICNWATIDSATNSAAEYMSGDPADTSSTLASQINLQPSYDLVMALIPSLVASYLNLPQSVPSSLSSPYSRLPNPFAWALAVNFWLEGRQAALQSADSDPTNACPKAFWTTGNQLQVAVRLAVASSTLQAAANKVSSTASAMLSAVEATVMGAFPSSVPTEPDLANLITTVNTPGSAFAAFDDACAVATLLLSLAQATGLGSNGFTNGFVSTGSASSPVPSQSFQPGQPATALTPFAPVTSTVQFTSIWVNSLNLTLSRFSNLTAAVLAQQQQMMFGQAALLLNWTVFAAQYAIAAFYPPCSAMPPTSADSLAVIDTTLRRLAGYMLQNQVPFIYQGQTVAVIPPAKTITPISFASASTSSSSSSASLSPMSSSSQNVGGSSVGGSISSGLGAQSSSSASVSVDFLTSSLSTSSISSGTNTARVGGIVGGVVGGVLVMCLLLVACEMCRRRNKYDTHFQGTNTASPSGPTPSHIEMVPGQARVDREPSNCNHSAQPPDPYAEVEVKQQRPQVRTSPIPPSIPRRPGRSPHVQVQG